MKNLKRPYISRVVSKSSTINVGTNGRHKAADERQLSLSSSKNEKTTFVSNCTLPQIVLQSTLQLVHLFVCWLKW